jgi:predicted amidohydrolase YtcJ
MLIARPNAGLLYAALGKGPKLPEEYQKNSTLQFMRELNRLGLTSAIDAGGGAQNYPEDYKIIRELEAEGKMSVRVAYNLFTQKPKEELDDFRAWTRSAKYGDGSDFLRHNGAGEMLVYSAADFEDFLEPRPDLPPVMEEELEAVLRVLVANRWPFRLHATYNESISRMLNVFEKVNKEIPFNGLPWFFDHAETISQANIDRVAALGGGIAIQNRMAFQGEYFVDRYGAKAAEETPPIRQMLSAGVPVGAGTDATRVSSFNPWISLYWLATGRSVGGLSLYKEGLGREIALELYTVGSAWFSSEQGKKGMIKEGMFADCVALSADYFSIPDNEIKDLQSVLTMVDGKVVYAAGEFSKLGPATLPVMPDWSPVAKYPGSFQRTALTKPGDKKSLPLASVHHCCGPCAVHGHNHNLARQANIPTTDYREFWGALGCSCFAF